MCVGAEHGGDLLTLWGFTFPGAGAPRHSPRLSWRPRVTIFPRLLPGAVSQPGSLSLLQLSDSECQD